MYVMFQSVQWNNVLLIVWKSDQNYHIYFDTKLIRQMIKLQSYLNNFQFTINCFNIIKIADIYIWFIKLLYVKLVKAL